MSGGTAKTWLLIVVLGLSLTTFHYLGLYRTVIRYAGFRQFIESPVSRVISTQYADTESVRGSSGYSFIKKLSIVDLLGRDATALISTLMARDIIQI